MKDNTAKREPKAVLALIDKHVVQEELRRMGVDTFHQGIQQERRKDRQ